LPPTAPSRTGSPRRSKSSARAAAEGNYIVQRGNNLWLIARQRYGEGFHYTAIYSANRGQIRDPNRIYPGQTFKLPKS
jgi:nucleoid-associated protein YgaU